MASLQQRLVEHLPAGDEVRKKAVKGIEQGLKDFQAATKLLDEARTADALARTRLTKAVDAWTVLAEKTYGALTTELGRAAADRFFPRVTRKVKKAKAEKGAGAADPG